MRVSKRRVGELNCYFVEQPVDGVAVRACGVLCHGFGAPGRDLVALGPEVFRRAPDLTGKVRLIFPEAPLSLDAMGYYGGRAWWMLDVERLVAAVERGETRILRDDIPEGLEAARIALNQVVETAREELGLATSQLLLGGFSQGSMVAADLAFRLPDCPGALTIFSGTLLCESLWLPLLARRGRLAVLQSHGRQDMILPFAAAEWLRDAMIHAGLTVDWRPFDGGHTIPENALDGLVEQLRSLAGG